ncbi:mitogen-activated protein kinase kinase kinase 1-like isoform X3, partial [Biomphalaria glabrata]
GNILMSSEESVKLTDFGLSKLFEEFSKASTTVGTIRYMAPEMFRGSYSYPVDI